MDAVVPLFSAAVHALGPHRRLLRALYVSDGAWVDTFPVRLLRLCLAWANTASRPASSDLLPHLSGLFRGALWGRSGSHSAINTKPGVYDLAATWFLLKEEVAEPEEIAPMAHTSAHWALHLNDAFYYSDLNAYFIRTRLEWLLCRAEPDPVYDIEGLRAHFRSWAPVKRPMRHLRTVIEPLFPDPDTVPPPPISKL